MSIFLKLILGFLCCQLAGAGMAVAGQQREVRDQRRNIASRKDCTNSERRKFDVKCKSRYFLGEVPTVVVSITNTGRSTETIRDAEYQKFTFEATGIFDNDRGEYKKTGVYDGTLYFPAAAQAPAPGQTREWLAPTKREPKFVKLAPGESTNLEVNLAKTFGSSLGVGKYELLAKSEGGESVVKEFEVYFDEEKSTAVFVRALAEESDRDQAIYYLARFNRTRLVSLLEDLAKSGNESQREFANRALAQIRAGSFDYLKLKASMKDRYSVGEKPILAISIVNNSSTVQSVTKAEYQKFSLELLRMGGAGANPEVMTCVHDGSPGATLAPTKEAPTVIKISELESTTVSLDLTECLKSKLSIGKYQLTVKSADPQAAFKYQTAVKTFEVH
jgi:hypothetical protein